VAEFNEIDKELLDKYSPPDELDIRQNPNGSFTTSAPRERDQRTGEVFEVDPATGQRIQTELPAGRTPSLVERLLGPQMQMTRTGFFTPENDYTGTSNTITRKGAHIAVANELAKIKFVAGTFGGMQNRVAIIRYWCKGDKCTQKATVASEAVEASTGASVPEKAAVNASQLTARPSSLNTLNPGNTDPLFRPLTPEQEKILRLKAEQREEEGKLDENELSLVKGTIFEGCKRLRIINIGNRGGSAKWECSDPVKTEAANNEAFKVWQLKVRSRPIPGADYWDQFSTPRSLLENPNFLNTITSVPRRSFPIPFTQPIPEEPTVAPQQSAPQPTPQPQKNTGQVLSATPGARSATATSPTEAAWQFLFNPEELQLESGPEFNRAETWGVSDLPGSGTANSGQPLAWRYNKNRKLSFGKVLLTGYVLGRRVDSLEKGLQQLFMARSGPGMDGPPVLEFVWGGRVFGPCVIQNLRVRERAWDDGYLVNAEVSFDLEQVPEWTINDGAVDIARPGRQSLVNDPFLPRAEPETGAGTTGGGGETQKKDEKGGGGGQSLTQADSYNPILCDFATKQSGIFDTFVNRNYGFGGLTTSLGNLLNARSNENIFEKFYNMKRDFYSGSQEIGNYVDNRLIQNGSPGCVRGPNPSNPTYKSQTQEILTGGGKFFLGIQLQSRNQQAAGFAKACAEQTKRFIDEWKKETPKCQAQRTANAALASSAEELRRCEQYKIGNSCNSIGLRATCSSINGGNTVYCRRNTGTSGPRYIWSAF
jgi:hypothetical protein